MQAPGELGQAADDDRCAERHRQPGPDVVLEGLPADAADQERVERPDDGRDCGRGDESSARIADKPAGEGHRGPAAGDEAADDDELRSEPLERPLGPRAGPLALGGGEEPALDGGPEPAAEQVAQVVAEEGADGRAGHQEGDARVAASRGGDAEGDDRGLARQDRDDRVERREEQRDQVGEDRVDLEGVEHAHKRPARRVARRRGLSSRRIGCSCSGSSSRLRRSSGDRSPVRRAQSRRMHSRMRQTPKMIHGATTRRKLSVIGPALCCGASGIAVRHQSIKGACPSGGADMVAVWRRVTRRRREAQWRPRFW